MDLLAGFLTTIIISFLYAVSNKTKQQPLSFSDILLFALILFCSYIYKPSENLILWLGWMVLFFICLDDWKTKSFFIEPLLIPILLFLFFSGSPVSIMYATFLFLLFYLIAKFSKEEWLGLGDAYLIIPLALLLDGSELLLMFILCCLLSSIFGFIYLIFTKETHIPFASFLILSTMLSITHWHIDFIVPLFFVLFLLLSLIYLVAFLIIRIKKSAKES